MRKVLICGYGSTANYTVDMLTRLPIDLDIHVMSRKSLKDVLPRLNVSIVSSMIMGSNSTITYHSVNMENVLDMADLFKDVKPDIIAYTGRLFSHVKYGSFSYPNNIGYGVWTPLAVPLIYNVMKAVKQSGIDCKVIDTSHPDIVEPLLKSINLNVFTGLGNINHMVPRIKLYLQQCYNTKDVDVELICSHFLNTYACREGSYKGSPYYLSYKINGTVRKDIPNSTLIEACNIPMLSDQTRNMMIASDVVQVIKILLGDTPTKIHLPGPNGLIGGYPCKIYPSGLRDDVELLLPKNITLDEAIKINVESSKFDGIESIHNGTVTFMDKDIKLLKQCFNLNYPKTIHIDECRNFADTVIATLEDLI